MAHYMASLARLELGTYKALLPAHGWLISEPQHVLRHYREHRMVREDKVWSALKKHGRATASMLLPTAYDDAPPSVWPVALFSVQAHLEHLVHRGLAQQQGDWFDVLKKA